MSVLVDQFQNTVFICAVLVLLHTYHTSTAYRLVWLSTYNGNHVSIKHDGSELMWADVFQLLFNVLCKQ